MAEPPPTPNAKSVSGHPTYIEHRSLRGMPEGIEPYPEEGDVSVHFGEIRCRYLDVLCGSKYQTTGALRTHGKNAHGLTFAESKNTGRPSINLVRSGYGYPPPPHGAEGSPRGRPHAHARLEPLRYKAGARAGQLNFVQMTKAPCDNCLFDFENTTTCHFHLDEQSPHEPTAASLNRKYWAIDVEQVEEGLGA
ncbi:hypothetical protein KJE20_14021 [Pyrenophora tritici-repentis]|nr:hypothetical protein KJE20_14122 [Pyrenophora tritici-repentis]KAI1676391.1 hypothetical protein KJE20_14021 [Pyrenophora tritici-repentis]